MFCKKTTHSAGNCDFDDGTMCTWKNLRNDDFDWLIGSGGTGTSFTGPSSDHTKGASLDGQKGLYKLELHLF